MSLDEAWEQFVQEAKGSRRLRLLAAGQKLATAAADAGALAAGQGHAWEVFRQIAKFDIGGVNETPA